jgi:hypothetical protein
MYFSKSLIATLFVAAVTMTVGNAAEINNAAAAAAVPEAGAIVDVNAEIDAAALDAAAAPEAGAAAVPTADAGKTGGWLRGRKLQINPFYPICNWWYVHRMARHRHRHRHCTRVFVVQ